MQECNSEQPSVGQVNEAAGRYLTFTLDGGMHAFPILCVQEIIGVVDVTPIPRAPAHIRGVLNLRGKVIPVVDLRISFGLAATEDTARTCIVVVQTATATGALTMGIVVDQVCEVLDIHADQIEPPPSFGSATDTSFMVGMAKTSDHVVALLDTDRVLLSEDLGEFSAPRDEGGGVAYANTL